jgi:DNA repair exonuclease SbcCD nuclease subunit
VNELAIRFAHMADTHLGAFRDPVLRELNLRAFLRALDIVREEECDLLVIAGDMFDTTLPEMDVVERAADALRRLGEAGVRTYVLYGSHDRSLTEKGIVDVLEAAGLFTNVGVLDLEADDDHPPVVVDPPTGTALAAVGGRQLSLERALFAAADWSPLTEAVAGAPLAIFGYHGPVEGMLPEELSGLEALERKRLPPGFDYYALGHVHHHAVERVGEGAVAVYPSPTFGASFTDLADGRAKGLVIVDVDGNGRCTPRHVPIELAPVLPLDLDVAGLSSEEARDRLSGLAEGTDPGGSIVLLRVHGTLSHGRPSDLDVPAVKADMEERGAEAVFVNRRGLRKAQAAAPDGGRDLSGLDREEIEDRTLRQALDGSEAPVPWLRGEEGLDLARELLRIAKEDRGDLPEAKHTEAVKARCMEVLALHERPGPDAGGDGGR